MKKLMIAAVTAAVAGGAFSAPLVYDYKASVKHMYEKTQRVQNADFYVKYVKSSKLQGYFIQDVDSATLLSQTELAGAANSQKKGFLVLINKSAERAYRLPKIMPAQLDVKAVATKVAVRNGAAVSAKLIAEAYFYAGPFAAFPDANNPWDASQDDGLDYMVNNGAANGGPGVRAYGTVGSTLYLFGQHNTYNRFDNTLAQPATICAFGDAWMNGAGFGTIGTATASLCCGWATTAGGSSVRSISGNLKGGLFLCSIGGYLANSAAGYFALGLEDLYKSDNGNALGKAVQGDVNTAEDPFDENTWADGDLALSTTDAVSGSWTLKPASSRFATVPLTVAEQAFFANYGNANVPGVLEAIKGACQALDRNYSLTTATEPSALAGKNTSGLISPNFQALYL